MKAEPGTLETRQAWHSLDLAGLLAHLGATDRGLSGEEAARRLGQYGPNRLPEHEPPAWWMIGLRQFKSPLIYILLVAAAVSLVIDHAVDAVFIGFVVTMNALIGGFQEWKAEQSSQALQKLLHIQTWVERDGHRIQLDAEDLVPGDIVSLESGNRVPADIRLLEVNGVEVDESLLTGESVAVTKNPVWTGGADTPVGDRVNMVFAGSTVVRGRARGVVVSTGSHTAIGEIATDVLRVGGGRAPLLDRMERFTRVIAVAVLLASVVVAVGGILLRGYSPEDMFLFAVALAVSAIPEGLPVAMTVALAIATTRMARRGVIVRQLAAVEGLGSCTLIASDKTGTLTCNELTVRRVVLADGRTWDVSGEGYAGEGAFVAADGTDRDDGLDPLLEAVTLCNEAELRPENDAWTWRGDPTEVALLSAAWKHGVQREALLEAHPQVASIPFEPEAQYAATFHDGAVAAQGVSSGNSVHVFVKGAPERVMGMCDLTDAERTHAREIAESMATDGLRVLAVASGTAPRDGIRPLEGTGGVDAPNHLTLLGFTGMIDPLRAGAAEAVAACRASGIEVCMITGDHPVTALAIARELGLAVSEDEVVSGPDVTAASPEERMDMMRRARVFARIAPRQKLELVEAAQTAGHYVAVTGDGVNDAPALRQANIGVAMGASGTDVARDAAELVITDDNFATIVGGIEEGRVAFDNVRKVIYLALSTGLAEVLMLGAVIVAGWPMTPDGLFILPLLPVQILWLNLVTNGIQDVALAFEPAEGDVLARRPRPPGERIFNRLMVERSVLAALFMSVAGLVAFWWMLDVAEWTVEASRNGLLLLVVLFQNLHIGNVRSETRSIFRLSPLKSPVLMFGVLLAFSIHMLAMHVPLLQRALGTEPVSLEQFAALFVVAMGIILVMELHKLIWRYRHATN
ncbi:MAG: HAD-IC family P-type ATPase [Rhodothermales bacterium]